MKRFYLVLLSLIIAPYFASGQEFKGMMYDPSINFYEVVESAENYFENNPQKEGSGFKGYQRWKYQNELNYFPSGDRHNRDFYFAAKQFKSFQSKNRTKRALGTPWRDLGPYDLGRIEGGYNPGLGRVESFYVDPNDSNYFYIGSRSGGFWKSTNGGQTWSKSTTDFLMASGVNTLSVSPTNRDSILVNIRNARNSTTHGIYRSVDGGLTWDTTAFNPQSLGWGGLGTNNQIYKVFYHPRIANKIFIGSSQGLYVSTDNLQTYSVVNGTNNISDIAFHPTADSIIYIYDRSSRNQILVSKDGGLSFTASSSLPNNNNAILHLSISPDCADCVFAASSNGVYISKDQGAIFSSRSNPTGTCDGFAVDDRDTSFMMYGMLNIYASSNSGDTFSQVTNWYLPSATGGVDGGNYTHADLREAASLNGVFYAATDGFFVRSLDKGQTWEILSYGTGIRENYAVGISQSHHDYNICGSQDNGTSILTKNGWLEYFGADGMEGILHTLNSDLIIGSVQFGGRYSSRDGGLNVSNPLRHTNGYWEAPLLADPLNQMDVYSFGKDIYKSTNFGTSWTLIGPSGYNNYVMRAAIAENNSDIIAISSSAWMRLSTDGAQSFTTIGSGSLPNSIISSITFAPKNDSIIIVTFGTHQNDGDKIYMTTDLGTTWTNITGNLGDMPLRSAVVDHTSNPNIYVGAEIGVFVKPLFGGSWQLLNVDLPNCTASDLKIMRGSNELRAATWGRGLWETDLINRASFPKIAETAIDQTPDAFSPKAGVSQYVRSKIDYSGTISSAYVKWGINSTRLDSTILMSLINGLWESNSPIPGVLQDSSVYFQVFAVGSSGDTSETYKFQYTAQEPRYCVAFGSAGTGSDWIERVVFDSIQQTSTQNYYSDYTNVSTSIKPNTNYTIQVDLNFSFPLDTVYAWIDYDQDFEFSDEELIEFSAPNANHEVFASFTTPAYTASGITRMRVRNIYGANGAASCGVFPGEVEDYSIRLRDPFISLNEENIQDFDFDIYPNPTEGIVHFEFPSSTSEGCLKILSAQAKLLKTICLDDPSSYQMDLNFLSKGVYIVRWESEGISRNKILVLL